MLWRKVQQYVVVGGAFVSGTSGAATANNGTNEQHQSKPQDQVRTAVTARGTVSAAALSSSSDQRAVLAPK